MHRNCYFPASGKKSDIEIRFGNLDFLGESSELIVSLRPNL